MSLIPTRKFDLLENQVASRLYGMSKSEAISFIKENELVPRILQEDNKMYPATLDYISHRLNIYLKKGRVISVSIG